MTVKQPFLCKKKLRILNWWQPRRAWKLIPLAAVQLASQEREDRGNQVSISTARRKNDLDFTAVKPRHECASSFLLSFQSNRNTWIWWNLGVYPLSASFRIHSHSSCTISVLWYPLCFRDLGPKMHFAGYSAKAASRIRSPTSKATEIPKCKASGVSCLHISNIFYRSRLVWSFTKHNNC